MRRDRSRAGPVRIRPRPLVVPDPDAPARVPPGVEAVVVGAGVAGISAAIVLAERGVRVTVLEAADTPGGRLAAWPHTLPDGSRQHVEHGFHAFFRHYYTWRAVLRRIDPAAELLAPVPGYPVLSRRWPAEDLSGLPATPPWNLTALLRRSPSLRVRDLVTASPAPGLALLAHDPRRTRARLDHVPASEFLDRMGLPERARQMLFEAFARSFFCDEDDLSAAELVAMFHFYFLANPEGLGFDAPVTDHRTGIWEPFVRHLDGLGADVRIGTPVHRIDPDGDRWRLRTGRYGGHDLRARHVILALDPGGLRDLWSRSPAAAAAAPDLAARCAALRQAPPFVVSRLWLDRDVAADRPGFAAVTGERTLDSIAVCSRLQRPVAEHAARTGGAVLELHSYAGRAPDAGTAADRMRAELGHLWPETRSAAVRHRWVYTAGTAPAFPPGSGGTRPGVRTGAPGLRVAGDFVELPYTAGLMERSALSGVLAANDVLAEHGARAEPVVGVPQRGLLAPWSHGRHRVLR